jgi:hypothetical protein
VTIDPQTIIDPLEVVVSYLLGLTAVRDAVGERVAGRHEFSGPTLPDETPRGWPTPSQALTLHYAGGDGPPDTATCHGQERVRLEARCYGETPRDAARVWGLLAAVCRAFTRARVELPDGRHALMYVLWPLDAPTAEQDPDTRVDYLRLTLRVWVSSSPVE